MAKEEKAQDDEKEEPKEGEEGHTEGEEGLNPPKKKLGVKLIALIAIVAVLVLGGAGAGLYFSGILGGETAPEAQGDHAAAEGGAAHDGGEASAAKGHGGGEDEAATGEEGAPIFFSLGDILVNLSGDGKRPNFLKIRVVLELANEKDAPAMETLKPRIIDHFQVYLRELRVEDLRGSAGLYRLREELLLRVTEAVQPIRVRDVLFQEMLVQ